MSADFERVCAAIDSAARALPEVITDDVWPYLDFPPSERNVIGKAFSEAKRTGVLRGTERFVQSRRPESKGRRVQVWESRIYGGRQVEGQQGLFG